MTTTGTDPRRLHDEASEHRRRLTLNDQLLDFRTVALLPAIMFVPTIAGELALPGTPVGPVFGILFHIAAFFFISRVPAPSWAKAAGFGWVAIDVAVGIMDINLVSDHIYMPLRLGGHVVSALWMTAVSLLSRPIGFRVVGLVTAALLAGYSFFGAVLPQGLLVIPSVGTVAWLVLAAIGNEPDPLGGIRRRAVHTA